MRILFVAVLLVCCTGFKISEQHDSFTKSAYLRANDLKLCQVRNAGFAATCATVHLVWRAETPEFVGVQLQEPGLSSITEIAVNIGGEVQRFGARVPVTDFDYTRTLAGYTSLTSWTSSNSFVLPLAALEGIAASKENGVIRVTGTHASTDYDFYRKAKARGVPADELRQFIEAITKQAPADSRGKS